MSQFIKSIAFDVRNALSSDFDLSLSQIHQLIASAFGYKTFAASTADEETSSIIPKLVIIDSELLEARIKQLDLKIDATEFCEKLMPAMEQAPTACGTLFSTKKNIQACLKSYNWDSISNEIQQPERLKEFVGDSRMDFHAYYYSNNPAFLLRGISFELKIVNGKYSNYRDGKVSVSALAKVLLKKAGACFYSDFDFETTNWFVGGCEIKEVIKAKSNEKALEIEKLSTKRNIDFAVNLSKDDLDLYKDKIRADAACMDLKELKYKMSQLKIKLDGAKSKISTSSAIKSKLNEIRFEVLREIRSDREDTILRLDKLRQKSMELPKEIISWKNSELIVHSRFSDPSFKRNSSEEIYNEVSNVIKTVSFGSFFERLGDIFNADKKDILVIQGNKVRFFYDEYLKDFVKNRNFSFDIFARSWDAPNDKSFDAVIEISELFEVIIEIDTMIIWVAQLPIDE